MAVAAHDFGALTEKLAKHGVGFTEILSAGRVLDAPQAMAGDKLSELRLRRL